MPFVLYTSEARYTTGHTKRYATLRYATLRLTLMVAAAFVILASLVSVASAAVASDEVGGPSSSGQTAPKTRITGLSAETSEDGSVVVTVTGSGKLKFTSFLLSKPDRVVVDFADAVLDKSVQPVILDDPIVRKVRAGMFTPTTARVVVDTAVSAGYRVEYGDDTQTRVRIRFQPPVYGVEFSQNPAPGRITLKGPGTLSYSATVADGGRTIVVDMKPATLASAIVERPLVGPDGPGKLLLAQFDKSTVRLVVSLDRPMAHVVSQTEVDDGGAGIVIDLLHTVTGIRAEATDSGMSVTVEADGPVNPTVFRLTNPERVVVDVPRAVLGPDAFGDGIAKTGYVKAVRSAQFAPDKVRVVFETVYAMDYALRPSQEGEGFSLDLLYLPLKGKVIVLDAGHGGKDPGAVSPSKLLEKDINLDIVSRLQELLRRAGAVTVMTRSGDTYPDLAQRVELANRPGVDMFISVHSNWHPSTVASGTEAFYYDGGDEVSKPLAEAVHSQLVKSLGLPDRKVQKKDYYVLRNALVPAVLVEVAFLSNPVEELLLSDPGFRQKAAEGIYKGILQYVKNTSDKRDNTTSGESLQDEPAASGTGGAGGETAQEAG